MQSKAHLSSYEDLEFSVTIVASVKDWRAMLKQLNVDGYPISWPLSGLETCVREQLGNLDNTHAAAVEKPARVR